MKKYSILLIVCFCFSFCGREPDFISKMEKYDELSGIIAISLADLTIDKELLYDQYTLKDTYPYRDTFRVFQWDKIKVRLASLEARQRDSIEWLVLQNYKEKNGQAPLVKKYVQSEYKRVADTLGTERYQGVPLYTPGDLSAPELYGRDGLLVRFIKDTAEYVKIATINFSGEWLVPVKYIKRLDKGTKFEKVIFVDRKNQNIASLERVGELKWYIRSKNPATTGLHRPPYQQETPTGVFVVQEKKQKMYYLKDGTNDIAGFAPYASRFSNGGYIHGVPLVNPRTTLIEYSSTLGTTPRSHMCVRNATSHAKFIYGQFPALQTLVFVIE